MKLIAAAIVSALAACGSAQAPQEEEYRVPHAEAAKLIVDTFENRCLGRGNSAADYANAGDGLQRTDEVNEALRELEGRRSPRATYHDTGLLKASFPLWVVLSTGKPSDSSPRLGLCEVIWSGDFPKGLADALQGRIGRQSQPPDSAQGGVVRAYPSRDGDFFSKEGLVLLVEKKPLHSVAKMTPLD